MNPKPMPKWMAKRQKQIYDRVCFTLLAVFFVICAFAFGCTVTWEMIYGKEVKPEVETHDKEVKLYAGFTDIDFMNCQVSVIEEPKVPTTSEIESGETKYTNEDYVLLAKLIYRETGNQGWDCMVACGSVVMNRVKSSRYPNTIKEVIFQKGQYSVTKNRKRFYNTVPSEDAYLVAELILNEGSQIPENVLYQSQKVMGSGKWKVINGEVYSYGE